LPITNDSFKHTLWPHLRRLLQMEQGIVFVGVLLCALFAVVIPGAPIRLMAIIILIVGNCMYFLQTFMGRLYSNLRFPWNWASFLPILAAGSLLSAFASIALVRWMQPGASSYWSLFRETWKIVVVVSMGVGIVGYAVEEVQSKLQRENKLLAQAVERGNVVLQQQEQELGRALEIQKDLLPKELPQLPGVELAGAWQPARTVGGDYFDVIRFDDDRLGICVGDVAGKGLTASLLMANLQAAFRAYATPDASPATVCAKLNAFVCGNVASGKFITFFYAILDAKNRAVLYENAGHCPGLLLRASGACESLSGQGGVLGVIPEWTYSDSSAQLAPGDRLLIFTDGVTEAENPEAIEFGSDRIAQAAGAAGNSAAETKRRVLEQVTKFCAGEFHDDVTLLVAALR
jgi:phosphoserine phosphatase RsbU/P